MEHNACVILFDVIKNDEHELLYCLHFTKCPIIQINSLFRSPFVTLFTIMNSNYIFVHKMINITTRILLRERAYHSLNIKLPFVRAELGSSGV